MHLCFYDTNFVSRQETRTAMCSIYGVGAPKRRTWKAHLIWNQSDRDEFPGSTKGKIDLESPVLDSIMEDLIYAETFLQQNGVLLEEWHVLLLAPWFQKRSILRAWHMNAPGGCIKSPNKSIHLPTQLIGHYCFPD